MTIKTFNFPANTTFTVRMGVFGTAAIGGTVVGTTDSGSGGSFKATYDIPSNLQGLIPHRHPHGCYFGRLVRLQLVLEQYDRRHSLVRQRRPVQSSPESPPSQSKSVVRDNTVTIKTNNFPANTTFTVRMGVFGTAAIGGTVVDTTDSGSGGSFTATYDIPSNLQGLSRIAIRMDATSGGFFAYNWFWNTTTP